MPTTQSGRLVCAAIAVIGSEDHAGLRDLVELLEDLEFELDLLDGGFHDEIGIFEISERANGFDEREQFFGFTGLEFAFLHQAIEVFLDFGFSFRGAIKAHVVQ
jgi:hypothetical protein